MKLEINLNDYGLDCGDTLGEYLSGIIKEEVSKYVRAEVKRQMASKEKEVKAFVQQIADRDWRKLAVMLTKTTE